MLEEKSQFRNFLQKFLFPILITKKQKVINYKYICSFEFTNILIPTQTTFVGIIYNIPS